MSDRYIDFANSPIGLRLVGALGLPSPVRLERWQAGRLRPIEGALLLGGGPLTEQVGTFAKRLTDAIFIYGGEPTLATEWIPGHGPKIKAVVYDASHLVQVDQLKQLREFFQPLMKNLDHSAHVVILGRAPESFDDPFAASAQRALEGFSRSLAKELRHGGTLQLLYVGEGAEAQLEGALRFFLSPKSAYVSGQVIRLKACETQVHDWTQGAGHRRRTRHRRLDCRNPRPRRCRCDPAGRSTGQGRSRRLGRTLEQAQRDAGHLR
jgi:3-oxoacyl-[acyl-carrier protein] reductase